MNKLIAIEWLKVKRYRTFWVLAGLFVVLLPLLNYEIMNGLVRLGPGGDSKNGINILSTAYSFPNVWDNVGFFASYFTWFICILVIILTTNEYTFRTHRQNVIDGLSRVQFFHSKVLMVVGLSVAMTVYYFLQCALFGYMGTGSMHGLFANPEKISNFFILSLDYLGFALLIALLIKRSGLAIGLFLLYAMIAESILKAMVNHYADMPYGNLLMLQSSDELMPLPLTQMAKGLLPASPISNNIYAIVALCWCAVYYIAGRALLQKRDM